MATHSTVGVNDDLAPSQPSIAHGSADNKSTGGVNIDFGLVVDQFCRDGWCDHVFDNVSADAFVAQYNTFEFIRMLTGYNNRMDANRLAIFILDSNLAFTIRIHPGKSAIFTHFSHPTGKFVGIIDRHRHESFGLIACISEHQTLVTSTACSNFSFSVIEVVDFPILIYALSNIRRLGCERY